MKYVGIGVLVFFGFLVLSLILGYVGTAFNLISLPWLKFNSQVNMNGQIIQKTYDANNAIYNYEWFKQRYEDIQAIDNKIVNAKQAESDYNSGLPKDRTMWGYAMQTESARLHSVVLGLQNQKEDLVAEYNARAKMANRNIFQNNLPLFIQLQ